MMCTMSPCWFTGLGNSWNEINWMGSAYNSFHGLRNQFYSRPCLLISIKDASVALKERIWVTGMRIACAEWSQLDRPWTVSHHRTCITVVGQLGR